MKRKTGRFLAFILAFVLCITVLPGGSLSGINAYAASYSFSGSGTETDPYLISSADDMVNLQEAVNSGKDYSGCYFELTADITLPDDWTAIGGSSSTRFYGTFDGGGHTITFPEGYTTADSYVGIFGYAGSNSNRVTIKNLTVDGEITASDGVYVGAIAAFAAGDIENCISNVTMDITLNNNSNSSTNYDKLYAGGLIGDIYGGSVSGCINNGDITYTVKSTISLAYPNTTFYGIIWLGGVVGGITYLTTYPTEIKNCMNTGNVTIAYCNVPTTTLAAYAGVYFGGVVGYERGEDSVVSCVNIGTLTMSNITSSVIYAGSVAGRNASSSTNTCYTTFDIDESYSSYSTEGDAITYVETFDMEIIWLLNTVSGTEENSMFWTLDDDGRPAAATDESPAVVRVLFQFADGTEEAVYVKAGSTASPSGEYSDASFDGFISGVTIVTEDITVLEYDGENEHNYVAVVTEPTCVDGGYTTYTCTECGASYIADETEATGIHTYVESVTSTGSYESTKTVYSCSVCGDTLYTLTSLYGSTRYETASEIIDESFESSGYAVITTGATFPDALAAASLAGALDAPIFIVNDAESSNTISRLRALGVETVYIVGGTSSVSAAVEAAIGIFGITVERISGSTRQETALAVAEKVLELTENTEEGASEICFVATGNVFADALSASAYSYYASAPIYLTKNDGSISGDVLAAIEAGGYSEVVILGGTSSVSAETADKLAAISGVTVERLGGATRYDTSVLIAEWSVEHGMSYNSSVIATGTNYPDALVASALCGQNGSVLLLSAKTAEGSSALEDVLKANAEDITDLYIVGGTSSVSEEVRDMITAVLQQ